MTPALLPPPLLCAPAAQFADTILKKYSSTIATIFTALMSWALFSHSLTMNFAVGVSIVFISMHQFFHQGGAAKGAVSNGGEKDRDSGHGGAKGRQIVNGAGANAPPTTLTYSPSMDHVMVTRMEQASNGYIPAAGSVTTPLLPR